MSKAERNENEDIFYNDWVACLCAHYLYTQEQGDAANALGLRRVLIEAGVSEAYIDSLVLPMSPSAETDMAAITELTETAELFDAEVSPMVEPEVVVEPVADLPPIEKVRPIAEPEMIAAPAVEETPSIEIAAVPEILDTVAETESIGLPLELPAALVENTFIVAAEPVAVVEMLPEPVTVVAELTPTPSVDPELTPDYPSGAKPKRGKRPPPLPQPTLF
jgi:hypothetical protein